MMNSTEKFIPNFALANIAPITFFQAKNWKEQCDSLWAYADEPGTPKALAKTLAAMAAKLYEKATKR